MAPTASNAQLGAADVFATRNTFAILESIRLDLGYNIWIHPQRAPRSKPGNLNQQVQVGCLIRLAENLLARPMTSQVLEDAHEINH